MKTTTKKTSVAIILITSLVLSSCGGCGSGGSLKAGHIYGAALGGALIGGIIGYQSDEAVAGALLGGAVFGIGELLHQIDNLADEEKKLKEEAEDVEEVVIQIRNSNGSLTPVEFQKKGSTYIGPKGEHYRHLPTQEQLRLVYAL